MSKIEIFKGQRHIDKDRIYKPPIFTSAALNAKIFSPLGEMYLLSLQSTFLEKICLMCDEPKL